MKSSARLLLTVLVVSWCRLVMGLGPDIGGFIGEQVRHGKEVLAEHAETLGHARLKEAERTKKEVQEAMLSNELDANGFMDFCRKTKIPIEVGGSAWLEDDRVAKMTKGTIKYLYNGYLNLVKKLGNRNLVSQARMTIAFHELLWFVEKRVSSGRRTLSSWIQDDKLGKNVKYSDVLRKFEVIQ